MNTYRYSQWDGSQDQANLDADELMDELGRNLMSYGDMSYSLRMTQYSGIRDSQGRRLPSLQEMLQRLRQNRQTQLEKYKLNTIMDEIKKKLDNIVKTEREGIQRRLDDTRLKTSQDSNELSSEMQQRLLKSIDDMATQNLDKLNRLPPDTGGQIRELASYDFMDDEARHQFEDLMDQLKRNAMESLARDITQKVKEMDPNTLANLRHMIEALNQMLEQRIRGEEPDFDKFMEQFTDYFGPQPPQSFDELMERLRNQMAQAQSLIQSMSPEDREALENTLKSALDEGTQYELAKLATNLEALHPSDKLHKRYPFTGEESISYTEALKLMEMLQKMDQLESQLRSSQYNRSLDVVDEQLVRELIGEDAAEDLEQLRSITRILEEAGYIRWKDGRYELTPRGMRKIGQKALEDIFAQLRKDRAGGHRINLRGGGGERIEETKKYEFDDDFDIHLQKTIMNSIFREPTKPPIKLSIDDFETYKTEGISQSATVLMLDLSLSMPMRGNFQAAKRVAVALDNLIRTQYPKDSLYLIGFSSYARRIKKEDLAYMNWDEFDPYTNMQHGLHISRKLLSKESCNNKQIILITDGEPTAHIEGGNLYFQYPPTMHTLQLTLREVRNCTHKGIVINTFMLETSRFLSSFVTQMAQINKGRVFFTNADNLGQYLLVDYISNKKRRI